MCNFLKMKMTEVKNPESTQWTSENASRPKLLSKIPSLFMRHSYLIKMNSMFRFGSYSKLSHYA